MHIYYVTVSACLLDNCVSFENIHNQLRSHKMTPPKTWYLDESSNGTGTIIIKNDGGAIRKPNASQPLGSICSVSEARAGSDAEGIMVCVDT